MSLDVYLYDDSRRVPMDPTERIYVRENGQTREKTRAEWDEKNPGREPVTVRGDDEDWTELFTANITHNLGKMAAEAGLYEPMWRPQEHAIERAEQLIEPLRHGLAELRARPSHFEQFNPSNGWGDYDLLVRFTAQYLEACEEFPAAKVRAWA